MATDEIAARRARLLGLPPAAPAPAMPPELIDAMRMASEAQLANSNFVMAMQARQDAHDAQIERLRDDLKAMSERCAAAEMEAARAQERATAAEAACAVACEALEHERARPPAPIPAAPAAPVIDVAAIAAAVVARMPHQAAPPAPKALIFETKDSMGNPRKVRVTPEH
jgi:hypothetical protein